MKKKNNQMVLYEGVNVEVNGVEDIKIVEQEDEIYVGKIYEEKGVGKIVKEMMKKKEKEKIDEENRKIYRNWGG